MILVAVLTILNTFLLYNYISPPPTTIIYGELNHTNTDDMECIMTGNDLTNSTAYYCCNMYRAFRTTDLTDNLTFDITQCIKIDNVYIKE
jgi:hypothetical protein